MSIPWNGNYMMASNMEWQQEVIQNRKELIAHIDAINYETKARGAVGMLTNDPHHWADYGVYTIGQFQDYLEREHAHNMRKEEQRG